MKNLKSIVKILKIHLMATWQRPITLPYPHIKRSLPSRTRGRLHNKIEDCIGCKACSEICPVSCIHITTENRLPGEPIPLTSPESGTQPIPVHVPQFDIDFRTCFQCGLCTLVCPTHCLTSTKEYEFCVFESEKLVWKFGAKPS